MVESNGLDHGICDEEHPEELLITSNTEGNSNDVELGDYCLVGWDLDTTGRRLMDEICHVAGYTTDDSFSLYVMPHGDVSLKARRRHMIRTVTVGVYRIIKDITSNKVLKTKSEVSALTDFLDWLEKVNERSGKLGVLLICHETFKFNACLLMKSLQEYNLVERFSKIVKGFVDCHNFAKKKCEQTMVNFSIRILSRVLLDKDNVEIFKANDRARLAYEIVQHLCAGESEIGTGAASPNDKIVKSVLPFTSSVETEQKILEEMRVTISRQNTLRPIFGHLIRFSTPVQEKRIALQLRKYLVDALIDYDTLKAAWDKGKEEVEKLLKEKLQNISDKDMESLVKMVVDHFENPVEPKPAPRYPRSENRSYYRDRRDPRKSSSRRRAPVEVVEVDAAPVPVAVN